MIRKQYGDHVLIQKLCEKENNVYYLSTYITFVLVDYKTYKLFLESLSERSVQNRKRIEKAPSIISSEHFQFLKFSEDDVR